MARIIKTKATQVVEEEKNVNGFNLTYNYKIDNNKVQQLTCSASLAPLPAQEGQPFAPVVGNAFFNYNGVGQLINSTFNQVPPNEALANHISAEFDAIVAENENAAD